MGRDKRTYSYESLLITGRCMHTECMCLNTASIE